MYDSDESLIVKACGRTPPDLISSMGNTLRLVFKTDSSRNGTGFKSLWFTDTDFNSIKSPNYPLLYPKDTSEVRLTLNMHYSVLIVVLICIVLAT